MKNIAEITIIGSGIIGLLTAKELTQAGVQVTIIEKNHASLESSWAGGGILLPLYPWRQDNAISTLVMHSLKLYPQLSADLIATTQIDPEWYQCGLLMLNNPDINLATAWCENHQVKHQTPQPDFFSQLNTQSLNPLWLPEIAQARNPRLLKSLTAYLLQQGVEFKYNCQLTGIEVKNHQIEAIQTTQGRFPVQHLVMATGAWTGELAKQLQLDPIPVKPMKGQMLLFQAQPNELPFMVLGQQHYLIPRRDGKILVGSTVEEQAFNKTTTQEAQQKLQQFAFDLFPPLKSCPLIGHWAGLRPATNNGVPYIDNHPEIKNLSLCAGHFRNGLVMSPASAQLIGDLILKRTPCLDPKPYQLQHTPS